MNRNYLYLIALISTPFFQASCKEQASSPHIVALEDYKSNPYHNYLIANYHHANGNIEQALASYQKLLKKNPSPHVFRGYFALLFEVGQFKTIVDLHEINGEIEKALQNNLESQLILAQSYLNLNRDEEAEKIFTHLAQKHPDNEQVIYFTCLGYLKGNQFDRAMTLLDDALNNFAIKQRHFIFYLLKSKILVQQNKPHEALVVIQKSIDQFPKFDRAILFKAVLLEQLGNIKESINGYKQFLDVVGRDLTVEKQLVQLLFSEQRYDEALNYLKKLKINTPDYFFDMGLIEFRAGNFKQALANLDQSIKLDPLFKKARLLKTETLLQMRKPQDALAFVTEWVMANPNDPASLHTLMLLRQTVVQPEAIIKKLLVIESKKNHLNVLAALADLYMETKKFKQAEAYFTKMLKHASNDDLKSKILFHQGYLYFVTNQHQKLEHSLKQAIACQNAYPSAHNLLAYHYAQNNKKLPEALKLIDQALAVAPHCFYYLDTKGYVLFKQGQKTEALALFQKAAQIAPTDQVIQNHIKLVLTADGQTPQQPAQNATSSTR